MALRTRLDSRSDGNNRLAIVDANGEVIATSEVYASLDSCKNGIASVQKNAPVAAIEDQTKEGFETQKNPKFEIYVDKAAEFRFRLQAANGQIIAENLNTDQKLRLATTNGRVTLDNVSGQDIDIRTSNGSVSGTVHGEREAFTIHSHTSNAGNNLMNREGGDTRLNIVTSNGAVNVSFTGTQEA